VVEATPSIASIETDRDLVIGCKSCRFDSPVVVEVMTPGRAARPELSSMRKPDGRWSPPLEDLWPFLPREFLRIW
jgi:hypothetical protein